MFVLVGAQDEKAVNSYSVDATLGTAPRFVTLARSDKCSEVGDRKKEDDVAVT